MHSPMKQLRFLNDRIVVRHTELARFVSRLSVESDKIGARGQKLKVTTIILGAFGAAQGVAVEIFGQANIITSVTFAIVGITIAALAGIDAAFKFETRAAELRMLAANCQAARFKHNSEWANKIATAEPKEAIRAARDLLEIQDRTVSDAQLEAAKLGINIALDQRPKSGWLPSGDGLSPIDDIAPDADFPVPGFSTSGPDIDDHVPDDAKDSP